MEDYSEYRRCLIVQASIVRAQIMFEGMKAENAIREANGEAPAYREEDFDRLIDDSGIGHDNVLATLYA